MEKLSTWLHPLNQCKSHPDLQYPGDGFAITDVPWINSAIQSGQVHFVSSIDHFTETTVVLSDGTVLDNIDIVLFCTGYSAGFPFLDGIWDRMGTSESNVLPTHAPISGKPSGNCLCRNDFLPSITLSNSRDAKQVAGWVLGMQIPEQQWLTIQQGRVEGVRSRDSNERSPFSIERSSASYLTPLDTQICLRWRLAAILLQWKNCWKVIKSWLLH